MAFVLADRVRETTTTNGTGAIYPSGVVTGGYQTFNSVLSNGDTTLCLVRNDAGQWQTFLGTWNSGTQSMARTVAYDGSDGDGVNVGFSGTAQEIWIDYPAYHYQNPKLTSLLVGTFSATQDEVVLVGGNVFGSFNAEVPRFKSTWNLSGTYTGSATNGLHLHEFIAQNHNIHVGGAGTFTNTYIGSSLGGSLARGNHVALEARIDQTSATANLDAFIVGAVLGATANSNSGGILGTEQAYLFGFNSVAELKTGATFFESLVGGEIDFVAEEEPLDKIGLFVVNWRDDAYSGSRTDTMIGLTRHNTATIGMGYGMVFGVPQGWWPIKATGTLIGAPYTPIASISAGAPAKEAAWGIDFSTVAFSGGFLKGPGFQVDGAGAATIGSSLADYLTITGAANTGVFDTAAPIIQAAGAATHIDLKALGKGTNGRLNSTKLYIGHSSARASVDDRTIAEYRANITYATTPVPAYRWGGNAAGTITSGTGDWGLFAIDSDTVDPTTGSGPGGITGFRVGHTLTGGKGGRNAFSAGLFITGAFTASATGNGSFLAAGGFRAQASVSAGGSAGVGNQRGNLFGINPIVEIKTGAGLYWQSICGGEITLAAETGTGVNYKSGFQVVQQTGDVVAGASGVDAGFLLINQTAGAAPIGWDVGYCFGSPWGWWPMKSTGTMVGTGSSFAGGPSYAAAYGVDFSAVTFSSGFLKSTGFLVDGSGVTTLASIIIGTSGPTVRAGTGAASGTQPKGSVWLRTDGGVGTTMYVSQGAGTWNAVAGV